MQPFRVDRANDVLSLTLDTPGSEYNVFSHDAALQLLSILEQSDPSRVRALVLRSEKPASFVNGVGLMMAGTAQAEEDIPRMTRVVTQAYRALREYPAPSVAAIRGNCYGCGVELALHCDHRLAAHTSETRFYMTEIAEYLFVPAFGSSQDLPHLIGLESAADALLWGQRWSAPEAARRGLVDAWFEDRDLEAGVERFVAELVARGAPKRRLPETPPWGPEQDEIERRTRARIAALPPAYRPVYEECLDLMVRAARKRRAEASDYKAELEACGRSVLRPMAKAALSIFFVRRSALLHTVRDDELPPTTRVLVDGDGERLAALRDDLESRRIRGVVVTTSGAAADGPADVPTVRIVQSPREAEKRPDIPAVHAVLEPVAVPLHGRAELVLYAPFVDDRIPVVEISMDGGATPRARSLFALLYRAGFQPVLSRSGPRPVLNDLLCAYMAPLVEYVLAGGDPRTAHASLRELGFVRSPAALLGALPLEGAARILEAHAPTMAPAARIAEALLALSTAGAADGPLDAAPRDAVLASLLCFATHSLETRTLGHPSVIDVLAREVLDFPLGHGSLCRYLTRARVADLARRSAAYESLLPPGSTARLARFVESGRDFYQQPGPKAAGRPALRA